MNRTGFPGGPNFWKYGVYGTEEDDEAVPFGAARLRRSVVREHEAEYGSPWAVIRSIAEKVGCNADPLGHMTVLSTHPVLAKL